MEDQFPCQRKSLALVLPAHRRAQQGNTLCQGLSPAARVFGLYKSYTLTTAVSHARLSQDWTVSHVGGAVGEGQHLRSASCHLLVVPRFQLDTYGRRTFAVAGPMTWNLFKNNMHEPDMQIDCFHRTLKTFLF